MFSGCDSEIHDRMLIKGIGIDYINDEYKISVRSENVTLNQEELTISKGKTVYDALSSLSLKSGERQMYADSYYIIFGEAAVDEGIDKALDFFIRYFKSTPTEQIFIAEGNAEDILNAQKDGELIPSDFIKNLKESYKNSGKTISVSLLQLLSEIKSPKNSILVPLIKSSEDEIMLSGAVLLKNYRKVCKYNEKEIQGFLIAEEKITVAPIVIDSDKYGKITLELNKSESKLQIINAPYEINLNIKVKGIIASITMDSYLENENIKEIEKEASKKIKDYVEKALKGYDFGADVLGINYELYKKENSIYNEILETENFERNYAIKVNVETKLIKTGEENRPTQ